MCNMYVSGPLVLVLLLVSLDLVRAAPAPAGAAPRPVVRRLAQLRTRLVSHVAATFPQAPPQERERLLRILVSRMKEKLQQELIKGNKGKEELLARMLR
jgi:hypothetical protein